MSDDGSGASATLSITADLAGTASAEFEAALAALLDGLGRNGLRFLSGPGGTVSDRDRTVGTVVSWEAGREVRIEWRPAPWNGSLACELRLRSEERSAGCRLRWELVGWERVLAASGNDVAEWVGGALLPACIGRLTPGSLSDWITDTLARRPSGRRSRETYRDPRFHWPNFFLLLDRIGLSADDRLLEVGCGGGAFLGRALESGCRAVGIDHSPEMLAVAADVNRAALGDGRLSLHLAEADRLPVASGEFTCVVCTGAFGFFPDPSGALREMRRALRAGGRLALFSATAELRGTPAAPEPIASALRWYDADEVVGLCRDAGFVDITAEAPDLERYARRAGLPDDALPLFRRGGGAYLVLARAAPPALAPGNVPS